MFTRDEVAAFVYPVPGPESLLEAVTEVHGIKDNYSATEIYTTQARMQQNFIPFACTRGHADVVLQALFKVVKNNSVFFKDYSLSIETMARDRHWRTGDNVPEDDQERLRIKRINAYDDYYMYRRAFLIIDAKLLEAFKSIRQEFNRGNFYINRNFYVSGDDLVALNTVWDDLQEVMPRYSFSNFMAPVVKSYTNMWNILRRCIMQTARVHRTIESEFIKAVDEFYAMKQELRNKLAPKFKEMVKQYLEEGKALLKGAN